jgi:hypothetical protein
MPGASTAGDDVAAGELGAGVAAAGDIGAVLAGVLGDGDPVTSDEGGRADE